MKKIVSILICIIMIMGMMPVVSFAAETVTKVSIGDITAPAPGAVPDYTATYGQAYNFCTDFDDADTSYGITWLDISNNYKEMKPSDTFIEGHKYRVSVAIKAVAGYSFRTGGANDVSGVSGTINGLSAKVTAITGVSAKNTIVVYYEFPACEYTKINSVQVTDLDVPASGDKFDFTATVTDDSYFINGIYWKDTTTNSSVKEGDEAVAGHTYEVEIWLRANDTYRFNVDGDGFPAISAKIGTYTASVVEVPSDIAVAITDIYLVPDDITTVTVSGLDAPVTGAVPDTTATCGSGYTITEIVWVDTTGEYKDYIYDITEFEAEREYTVQVTLKTVGNYRFVMDGPYNDVSGKINNNTAIVYGSNSSTEVSIGYEFPATEKPAPTIISSVYVNGIDAPIAGIAPDTEGTCGEGYKITKITWVDTTDEYTDWVYDITEFEAGRKYTVQIDLVTEENYLFRMDDVYTDVTGQINMETAIVYGSHSDTEVSIGYDFGEIVNVHTHNHTAVVTAPTCTEKGYTTYTCSCGDTYKDDETDATGHTPEVIPGKEATTTETGLTEGEKCSVCDTVTKEQEVIPALSEEHIHEYTPVVTASTCTEKGFTTYSCSCGESYVDDYIDAPGHIPGEWEVVKAAEIGVEGKEQQKCSICKEVIDEKIIPALEDDKIIMGDVNNDGEITASDARLALRISASIDIPDEYQKKVADINTDEEITASDARKILRISAGLE